jgi:Restriction endonuclease BglII
MLTISSESHLFGETIAEYGFPTQYDELSGVLGGSELPLRVAEPFTERGRPATPKRQMKPIGGHRRFALFPVDQGRLNQLLHDQLRDAGWVAEPVAAGSPLGAPADLSLRGDFAKEGVFVEVEFGNSASLYRDLFKFQIASRSGAGEVAILITATAQLAKFFDSGVATFEQAAGLLPYMRIGIQMPVWIVGIEPTSWEPVKERYEMMHRVASENGLGCHPFETIFGSPLEPPAPAIEGDDVVELEGESETDTLGPSDGDEP